MSQLQKLQQIRKAKELHKKYEKKETAVKKKAGCNLKLKNSKNTKPR